MDSELWKKAEGLFIRCADLTPAEAGAFLDTACTDPTVREAVESLLRGDSRDDELKRAVGRAASSLAETQKDRWIGARVGAYTVASRIAEGGMGAVYRASRADLQFEQHVAIKFLTGTVVSDELRTRFMAERQILATLGHANIAKLLDGGETGDGVPYLVMEYIDGAPIDEYCAANRLTVDERIALFLQICSAVQYAHGNLIVHRDIKPSNILVGKDGVPKLLDFGIAKMLDVRDLPFGVAVTVDGSRLLTPRHASPEQILGRQVTTVSDVYSLGLLLYELLCGRFPYDLDKTTRVGEVENVIVGTDPLPPSARIRSAADIDAVCRERRTVEAKLRQNLRGDLDTIVLTALRKKPESRYASAKELADDLRRAAEHRPILARPPTLPYVVSRYWQRHRAAVVGISATVFVSIVGAAVSTVGFFRAREAERVAVAESRNAAATSDFLVGLFRASDPDENAGNEKSVTEVLRLGVERIETEMDDTPIVKSKVLETLSSVYKARYDHEQAARLQERALRLHEAYAMDDPVGSARLNNDLGDLYRLLERYDDATRHLELAYTINRESGNDTGEAHADVINNLALVYGVNGRTDEVAELFLEALRLRKSLYAAPHAKIALSLHNLGWHYNLVGELDAAERYALQALKMRIELFGEVHPRVASTMGELSDIYFDQARWKLAESSATRALAIAEQVFEPGHRAVAYQLNLVARSRHALGDLRGASVLYAEAIADGRRALGPEHPLVGTRLKAYARCLLDLGNYRQAEVVLREASAIFSSVPDGPTSRLVEAETLLADTLLRTGRGDEALELLGSDDPVGESPERRLLRARLMLASGDATQAEQATAALLQELERTTGHHLPLLPQILQVQGLAQIAAGRPASAIAVLERALSIYSKWWGKDYWRADLVRVDLGVALIRDGKPEAGRSLLADAEVSLKGKLGADHPDSRRAASLLDEFSKPI